jgi:exonuclease III
MASDPHCNVLNWNVRGLNNPSRWQVVRDLIADNVCTIVCIQETKLRLVDGATVVSTLGQKFVGQYAALPADGTRGGEILTCSQDFYSISQVDIWRFSVTATITRRSDNEAWSLIAVYGPQKETDKLTFLEEIGQLKQSVKDRW